MVRWILVYGAFKLTTSFFAGAALWVNRDVVPLHTGGSVACAGPPFAASTSVAYVVCLPYLVMFAALKTPVISLERIADLSNGTYQFAFPIQQSLISTFGPDHIAPLRLSAVAIPIVLTAAFISWHLV